jgi:hypothetical protein
MKSAPALEPTTSVLYAALAAVTDNVNQSKGDRDLAGWLPPPRVVRAEVFGGGA